MDQPYVLPKTNCYSCMYANSAADRCAAPPLPDMDGALGAWIRSTHGGAATCPPEADGCPSWKPDPAPVATEDLLARVEDLEGHVAALEREL